MTDTSAGPCCRIPSFFDESLGFAHSFVSELDISSGTSTLRYEMWYEKNLFHMYKPFMIIKRGVEQNLD